jgi:hypothetical protein
MWGMGGGGLGKKGKGALKNINMIIIGSYYSQWHLSLIINFTHPLRYLSFCKWFITNFICHVGMYTLFFIPKIAQGNLHYAPFFEIPLRARQWKLRTYVNSLNQCMCTRVQRFSIFDQIESPRPEMDVKWNSKTHLQHKFFVFSAFLSEGGFKGTVAWDGFQA